MRSYKLSLGKPLLGSSSLIGGLQGSLEPGDWGLPELFSSRSVWFVVERE